MKKVCTVTLMRFVLSLLLLSACNSVNKNAPDARIDELFKHYNSSVTPGCAVAVIQNGEVIFKKGYGMANLEYDIPISPSTVFDIASVSKQFAGLAISTLVDQGKINLDDDVRKYLPDLPDFGKVITIRHLVHHTSGLRDWPETLHVAGWRWDEVFSFDDIMRMVKKQKDLDFLPGEKFSYSNTGYNLLAAVVAKVSGKTFPEWTEENIFEPLQMNSSRFLDDHTSVIRDLAYSYHRSGEEFKKSPTGLTAYGSSSLFATADDLCKWVIHFDRQIRSKNRIYTRMLGDGVLTNGSLVGYGFGLGLGEAGTLKTVLHTGGWAGYRTIILNFPDEKLSCILLSNSSDFNAYGNAVELAKLFLKSRFKVEETKNSDAKNQPTVKVDTLFAKKCTGIYQLDKGWYVTITLENGQLMTQANGESKFSMQAKSDSVYWIDAYNASMTFVKDKKGEVNALRYKWIKEAKKITPIPVDIKAFGIYTGAYFSEELFTHYTIDVTGENLMIRHMRLGDFELRPDPAMQDQFTCNIGVIQFVKNQQGKVTGFRLSGGRIKNIHFDKEG